MLKRWGKRAGVPAALAAGVLLVAAAGCGSTATSHALFSTTIPWGSGTHTDPIGQVWAATQIPLCTKGHRPVTLTSIEPVKVSGQIRLDRILVKRGQTGELAFYQGAPPGSRPVAGFAIPSPSPSPCARQSPTAPLYEAIVLAHRTGPQGGLVAGLRVHYHVGDAQGVYTIPFTDVLCGDHGTPESCQG